MLKERKFTNKTKPFSRKKRRLEIVNELIEASTSKTCSVSDPSSVFALTEVENIVEADINIEETTRDKQVQVKPHYRSKAVQCSEVTVKKHDKQSSPIKIPPQSPVRLELKENILNIPVLTLSQSSTSTDSDLKSLESGNTDSDLKSSESVRSECTSSSESSESEDKDKELNNLSIKVSLFLIEKRSKFYLGLPNECYFVLSILQKYVKCEFVKILIVLKKIKTDSTYLELGDNFGMTASNISRIFTKNLPTIASLKKLIVWPRRDKIIQNVPIAFRARFSNVQSIIDCFEIEIEKPTDALKQSMTWSEYKKCNTIKYFVSCTPDGIINFISNGFGGRATDTVIVEHSRFLDILPAGCSVMADRGFKHVEPLLARNHCKLVRPPSVPSGTKISKSDVLLTKTIASLRTHVERLIRRIREFKMLRPHAVTDHQLIVHLDYIINIVCGLINLQAALIK